MGVDIFYNLDAELIIFGLIFVLFFAIIRLALSKTIKDKGPLGVISLSIALLSVYGLSKTNLDFPGFFLQNRNKQQSSIQCYPNNNFSWTSIHDFSSNCKGYFLFLRSFIYSWKLFLAQLSLVV